MTTQVLVFESDAAFAQELEIGLAEYGCQTTVVDDANAGLQAAASEKPDLILLSIELPRMNGFSVCNKLKRDAGLKEVPLIIMSSDSTEETFEQHRRLRTRAEDYVHKPISVGDLVAHIQELLPLESNAEGDESIIIDDDIEIEDADGLEEIDDDIEIEDADASGVASVSNAPVDQEVDDFTEQAFGALMGGGPVVAPEIAVPAPPPSKPPVADLELDEEEVEVGALSEAPKDIEEEELPGAAVPEPASIITAAPLKSSPPSSAPVSSVDREAALAAARKLSELEEQLTQAKDRISELETEVLAKKRSDAEVVRLDKEVVELRQKLASKSGGSAREFLDLREQLNSKDKEILEIRDQLNHREKELLGLRDNSLSLEREKADLEDRAVELERKLTEVTRTSDALRDDKEQAGKRADDYKRKAEKLKADLDTKAHQFEEISLKHQEELVTLEAQRAALVEEQAGTLERTIRDAEQRQSQAVQSARDEARLAGIEEAKQAAAAEQAQALAARETELKGEHDSKMAALHRANEDSLAKLRAEHEQTVKEAADEARQRLEAREEELARDHSAQLQELSRQKEAGEVTRDARIASLEGDLVSRTLERDRAQTEAGEREQQLSSLNNELTEAKKALAALEATTTDQKQRIADLDAALSEQNEEYAELSSKLQQRDHSIAALEADLSATRQRLSEANTAVEAEQGKVMRARQKWSDDRASLERAKDALAAALVQLEETETRSLE